MKRSPSQRRRKRLIHVTLVFVAVMALGAMSLGIGDVVRAAMDPPQVQPYDPLVRW